MQGALTGGDKQSRLALERHTAELESDLLHMHTQCGQLKARLDASQALNNELQRALVDTHVPQASGIGCGMCMISKILTISRTSAAAGRKPGVQQRGAVRLWIRMCHRLCAKQDAPLTVLNTMRYSCIQALASLNEKDLG